MNFIRKMLLGASGYARGVYKQHGVRSLPDLLRKHGIAPKPKKREEVRRRIAEGQSVDQIAREMGISSMCVYNHVYMLRRAGTVARDRDNFVCGPCRYDIRRFEGRIKGAGTRQLLEEGHHPLQDFTDADGNVPSPWSVKPWVVYLFTDEDVIRSIEYANDNLRRSRVPKQRYSFIVRYAAPHVPVT